MCGWIALIALIVAIGHISPLLLLAIIIIAGLIKLIFR